MGKFVIKVSPAGFKFDLKAGNGEIIASSQVYKNLASCKVGIKSVETAALWLKWRIKLKKALKC